MERAAAPLVGSRANPVEKALENRGTDGGIRRWTALGKPRDKLWLSCENRPQNDFARQGQFPVRAVVETAVYEERCPRWEWEAEITSRSC